MKTKIEKQFTTEAGFEAFVVLNESTTMSWRCGYVIIPKESSLYKLSTYCWVDLYDLDLDDPNTIIKLKQQQSLCKVDVNCGITYNDFYDDKGYCLGLHCAHSEDTVEVQTLEYCINECESLAKQLKEIEAL